MELGRPCLSLALLVLAVLFFLDGPSAANTRQRRDDGPFPGRRRAVESITCKEFNETVSSTEADGVRGSVAKQMCLEYQRQICSGEVIRNGGFPSGYGAYFQYANRMEFPHMALLGYGNNKDNIKYKCGGSLISTTFVLTAAHCSHEVRWVLLGALNRTSSPGEAPTRQLIEVKEVIVHPEYSPRERYHDVALLRLATPAYTAYKDVQPACLHTDLDELKLGEPAVATGWGARAWHDDEGSEALLKGKLALRPLSDCDKVTSFLPRGLDKKGMLCAGGDGVNPTDTCQGDSGGPLQLPIMTNCVHRVLGVVSFGPTCGLGLPGVYTRVATYVPWIESVVWPGGEDGEQCLPNTGPGTVARQACNAYLRSFCNTYDHDGSEFRALPSMRPSERCHYQQRPDSGGDADDDTKTREVARYDSPHMVQFLYGEQSSGLAGCAGVIIAPDFVLTAAHCASLGCAPLRRVLISVFMRSLTSHPAQILEVAEVIVHPGYSADTRANDIALVRLEKAISLSFDSRPACLQTEEDEHVREAIATGLTAREGWDHLRGELVRRTVAVERGATCGQRLEAGNPLGVDDSHLCTGGRPGQLPFPGDSGSPLQVVHRVIDNITMYRVAGVLSVPSACDADNIPDGPDVLTRVAAHVPWIESVVWPQQTQQMQEAAREASRGRTQFGFSRVKIISTATTVTSTANLYVVMLIFHFLTRLVLSLPVRSTV